MHFPEIKILFSFGVDPVHFALNQKCFPHDLDISESGRISPIKHLIITDFPEPDFPIMTKFSPSFNRILNPLRTSLSLKLFLDLGFQAWLIYVIYCFQFSYSKKYISNKTAIKSIINKSIEVKTTAEFEASPTPTVPLYSCIL